MHWALFWGMVHCTGCLWAWVRRSRDLAKLCSRLPPMAKNSQTTIQVQQLVFHRLLQSLQETILFLQTFPRHLHYLLPQPPSITTATPRLPDQPNRREGIDMQLSRPVAPLTSILLKESKRAKNRTLRHLEKEHHLHHRQRLEGRHLAQRQSQKAKRLSKLECV